MITRLLPLFTCLCVLCYGQLYAQTGQPDKFAQKVQNVVPVSPNAASIAKYGDIPVGNYTGAVQMNIPLYQIEGKGISLPISLSHAGGAMKVADIGSWVGTGWTLNAGGAITRSIQILPDEQGLVGYFQAPAFPTVSNNYNSVKTMANYDYQPDMFFYNFNSASGKFVFNKNKEIKLIPEKKIDFNVIYGGYNGDDQSGVLPLPQAMYRMEATDESGIKYIFDEREGTPIIETATSGPRGSTTSLNIEAMSARSAVQSWYLSRMISPLLDTINFEYVLRTITYNMPPSVTIYSLLGTVPGCETFAGTTISKPKQTSYSKQLKRIRFSNGTVEFISNNKRYDLPGDSTLDEIVVKNINQQVVKRIQFKYKYLKGNVMLNPVDVPNLPQIIPDELRLFLDEVQEIDPAAVAVIPPHHFEYIHGRGLPAKNALAGDYWGYHNGVMDATNSLTSIPHPQVDPVRALFYSLKQSDSLYLYEGALQKVDYPTGGSTQFDYEPNKLQDGYLPPTYRTQSSRDFIATKSDIKFANELTRFTINSLNPTTRIDLIIGYDAIFNTYAGLSTYQVDIINVSNNQSVGTYNAGQGSTSLNNGNNRYECNTGQILPNGTYKIVASNPDLLPNDQVDFKFYIKLGSWVEKVVPSAGGTLFGGIRIKQIADLNTDGSVAGKRYFVYESPYKTGHFGYFTFFKQVYKPTSDIPTPPPPDGPAGGPYSLCDYDVLAFDSYFPLSQTQGAWLCYQRVKVLSLDPSGVNNGYTEFEYYNNSGQVSPPFIEVPFCPIPNTAEWMNGVLRSEKSYQRTGANSYSLIKEVSNVYHFPFSTTVATAGKTMETFEILAADNWLTNDYAQYFNYTAYDIYSGHPQLDSTVTLEYTGSQTIRNVVSYVYNDWLLPSNITSLNSLGESVITKITYPFDYTGLTSVTGFAPGIKNLYDKHIINVPVEKSIFKKSQGSSLERLTSAVFTAYKPGLPLPDKIYSLEAASAVTNFSPASVQSGDIVLDSRHKPQVLFNKYDSKGNLLEQQKANDVIESYIWGYNSAYPVAKIVGVDHTTASQHVTLSTVNNSALTDAQMRTALQPLRTNLPNAHVTTLTYTPLIGQTSVTGPEGRTQYFEYDGFGRLKVIRDQQGKILKQFDYQYKSISSL